MSGRERQRGYGLRRSAHRPRSAGGCGAGGAAVRVHRVPLKTSGCRCALLVMCCLQLRGRGEISRGEIDDELLERHETTAAREKESPPTLRRAALGRTARRVDGGTLRSTAVGGPAPAPAAQAV